MEQTNRRPANESIWYVLATVAGETKDSPHYLATARRNRNYWNGLMKARADTHGVMVQSRDGQGVNLPVLEAEDYETILQALGDRGFQGVELPDVFDQIDFSNVDFPDLTWFEGFVFVGPTSFDGAKFAGTNVGFRDAIFATEATFVDAEFCGQFFGIGINFAGTAHFNNANFRGPATFGHSVFGADAEFNGASFLAGTRFNSCRFTYDVRYVNTVFEDRVDFRSARFEGQTHFEEANFKRLVPEFYEASLYEYTEWHDAKWPEKPKGIDQALDHINGYQRLARLMNELGKFDDQRLFVRKEMRVRRQLEWKTLVGWMNFAYWLFCDYGHGLVRVALWWSGHIFGGGALLYAFKIISIAQGAKSQPNGNPFSDLGNAILLSFGNAHGFLDLNRRFFEDTGKAWEEVPCFEGIGATQTVLGVVFLFFLLLTIRNRFRMR